MQYDMSVERSGMEGGVRSQSDMLNAFVRLLGENEALSKELDENREVRKNWTRIERCVFRPFHCFNAGIFHVCARASGRPCVCVCVCFLILFSLSIIRTCASTNKSQGKSRPNG
jgi:hypothetical protein